jgi:hypothetical protein
MIVSGYFSHRYSHGTASAWGENWLRPYRAKLDGLSKEAGLNSEIRLGHSLGPMARWNYDDPDVLEVKFEDLVESPLEGFSRVFNSLQLEFDPQTLEKILEDNTFKNVSGGRERGQEDARSHFRKGVSGDWKNHFSDENVALFKEKWGSLLVQLGYEKDDNWS